MVAFILLGLATLGLVALLLQAVALRVHLGRGEVRPRARVTPGVSVLKPLCGLDDDLEANLLSFNAIDYPDHEILLGVRDAEDAAYPLARSLARRHPERYRVVVQRGAPGQNPKVNQLISLAKEARHEVLVVSDSNVRVGRGYLAEVVAGLADPRVGLVTHPIVGGGPSRRCLGSRLDALHLAGSTTPGVVGARLVAGLDIVVGKSMAFRRRDLAALGGFESVKDVLAEDYVLGRRVVTELGLAVHLAASPIINVSGRAPVRAFVARTRRWSVLHRRTVGMALYLGELLLNPIALAAVAVAADPSCFVPGLALAAAKIGIDALNLRALGSSARDVWLVPLKDLIAAAAWLEACFTDRVTWRGTRLHVLAGTRLAPPALVTGGKPPLTKAGPWGTLPPVLAGLAQLVERRLPKP